MDKREIIEKITSVKEERLVLARVYERMVGAERKNIAASTCFLSQREQIMAKQLLPHTPLHFFGGSPDAERQVCCYIPDYYEPIDFFSSDQCPICALRATFYQEDTLSHRDFLGSLMGSGIKRETVGDIYVGQSSCDFLILRELMAYVEQNLLSAGRTKLRISPIDLTEIALPEKNIKEIRDTVSSLRLDNIVASGFSLSREKASQFIQSGKVNINWLVCEKPDKTIAQGDQISLRGLGKIQLITVGTLTKKGRVGVLIGRYQ